MPETAIRLRPELSFSPTRSRDSVSYVIEDRVLHKFWKIGQLEYEVCTALDGTTTALEALKLLMQRSPLAIAAGPERVHKILVWLVHSGLIESCSNTVHDAIGAKDSDKPSPEKANAKPAKLFDPSFFSNPDPFG